jgi:hypothetical protein
MESGGNYGAFNAAGQALGRYQMQPPALRDAGFLNAAQQWIGTLGVIALVLFGSGDNGAGAGERLIWAQGRIESEPEWQAILGSFKAPDGTNRDGSLDRYFGDKSGFKEPSMAWDWARANVFRTLHYDLDLDGDKDLIVRFDDGMFCGTAGCEGAIFVACGDGCWRQAARFVSNNPTAICITEVPDRHYPVLNSYAEAVWWNGATYAHLCLAACSQELEVSAELSSADQALRERLMATDFEHCRP